VSAGSSWSLALIAVLLLDAFAPLSAGFWLSFVAVGVILIFETTPLHAAPRRWHAVTLQIAVLIALSPLTFAVFGGVSLVGLVVNLLAIPVISFVFVPLVLAGVLAALAWPAADGLPFGAAAALYEWMWPALVGAADLPFAQWRMDPPLWWYALAAPAALWLLRRWPPGLRLTAVAATALPLVCAPSRLPEPGTLRVEVFDTGRGSVAMLTTHDHVVLFDTGDSWNTRGTRLAQVVDPALDALGRRRIDMLFLPALNPDRALAAAKLAIERGVGRIVVAGGWPGTSLPVENCVDTRFHRDGIDFDIYRAGRDGDSCVLRVSAGRHSLLLAGDLDAAAEQELLARLPPHSLASDVVVMSRHAGAAGSSQEWIDSIRARLAVAAGGVAGSGARARTVDRWRGAGARILDTRRDGGIEIGFGSQGIVVRAAARAARYPFAWRRVE
jgi:competence protein ComEC